MAAPAEVDDAATDTEPASTGQLTEADVTVVIVPRERYGGSAAVLADLLATVPSQVPVRMVLGGMGRRERRRVAAVADGRVELLLGDGHLSPTTARNRAAVGITSELVAFVDNDVRAEPGWLEALVASARSTGAAAVNPLVRVGDPGATVHFAGGDCRIVGGGPRRRLETSHWGMGQPVARFRASAHAGPTPSVELHAVVVRRDVFEAIGGLDEELVAQYDHYDLSLRLAAGGHVMWVEPAASVTYLAHPARTPADVAFFRMRWSEEWSIRSHRAFASTWGTDPDPAGSDDYEFCEWHRLRWIPGAARLTRGARSRRYAGPVLRGVDRVVGPSVGFLARAEGVTRRR